MTFEPSARVWTRARLLLALVAFALLAVTLPQGCNPSDNTNTSAPQPGAQPAGDAAQPSQAAHKATNVLPDELTGIEMRALDGRPVKLADYKGRIVVLNLWATWCGPCKVEIPELIEIHEQYKGRGVELLGMTVEEESESAEEVKEFVKSFKINYPVIWADRGLAMSLMGGNGAIPQTFIIAPDGRLAYRFTGYNPQTGLARVRAAIEETLNKQG